MNGIEHQAVWNFSKSLVYTGFCFIQDSVLFRILVYTGFCFIQDSGLYRILVYTGFWFIQGSIKTGLTVIFKFYDYYQLMKAYPLSCCR